MHEKDRALIQSIQDFFGGIGHVSKPNNSSMVEFRVNTVKDLVDVIIPHFFVLLLPLLSLRPACASSPLRGASNRGSKAKEQKSLKRVDNYPLSTKKYLDYLLFKKIVFKMLNKEQNTYEGLQEIVNIRSSLNLGLSNELKKLFLVLYLKLNQSFYLKIEVVGLQVLLQGNLTFLLQFKNLNLRVV
jgi:hypothetical protein